MVDTIYKDYLRNQESRARTDLMGAQEDYTRTRDFETQAMLPGRLEKQTVDLDTAKLIYSNLLADETYNDLVRKIKLIV